ncbi:MAG: hypothetical protein ACXWP4_01455 [Polyangiales bacterium]
MKRASFSAAGVLALVLVGCATGGQDDTAPRADTGHGEDASLADGAIDSSVAESSTDDTSADSSIPDTAPPDTTISDIGSETAVADTAVADTAVADTTAPDTAMPDTAMPDTPACVVDTTCGAGKWCSSGACVACDTVAHCGPTCATCSGTAPLCGGATAGCQCTTSPDSCGGTTSWCTAGKTCATCSASACGDGRCDCGETSATCATDCPAAVCPAPLVLGAFDSGADSWTFDGLWRFDSGSSAMVAGSTTKYSSSYTQNLTNPANVDLSACTTVTLSFSVSLADDPDYSSKGPDKSERLYVQCSGDGGGTWTNLVPSPWPTNQSACSTSYCCGGPGSGRSFPLTAQSITLPAACRTATTRIRFQAKGSSVWNLQNPGWYVDNVKLN